MTMPVLSGRSVTFCSLLDLLLNETIKIKVAEFDRRWFIVALFILIGNKFKIFSVYPLTTNKNNDEKRY
jgi:hypothetical protein